MVEFEAWNRLQGLGTFNNPGLLVSVAPGDILYGESDIEDKRVQIATAVGANAVYGELPYAASDLLGPSTNQTIGILAITDNLREDVEAAQSHPIIKAVGMPWNLSGNWAAQSERLRQVRGVVNGLGGDLFVVVSFHPAPNLRLTEDLLAKGIATVDKPGAHADAAFIPAVPAPWVRRITEGSPRPMFLRMNGP